MSSKLTEFFELSMQSTCDLDNRIETAHKMFEREKPASFLDGLLSLNQVKTLSSKVKLPCMDSSFQRNFLKEHEVVFKEEFKQYNDGLKKEGIRLESLKPNLHEEKWESEDHHLTAVEIILKCHDSLKNDQKLQFLKDLQYQEKLREFLDFVAAHCPTRMTIDLLTIVYEVWKQYVIKRTTLSQAEQYVNLAIQIAHKEINSKPLRYLYHNKSLNTPFGRKCTKFIQVFLITVILIINEYFLNPFYEKQDALDSAIRLAMSSHMRDCRAHGWKIHFFDNPKFQHLIHNDH